MKESKKRGRKKLPKSEKMVDVSFKLKPAQKIKVRKLGMGKWLRKEIDNAEVPKRVCRKAQKDEVK